MYYGRGNSLHLFVVSFDPCTMLIRQATLDVMLNCYQANSTDGPKFEAKRCALFPLIHCQKELSIPYNHKFTLESDKKCAIFGLEPCSSVL